MGRGVEFVVWAWSVDRRLCRVVSFTALCEVTSNQAHKYQHPAGPLTPPSTWYNTYYVMRHTRDMVMVEYYSAHDIRNDRYHRPCV